MTVLEMIKKSVAFQNCLFRSSIGVGKTSTALGKSEIIQFVDLWWPHNDLGWFWYILDQNRSFLRHFFNFDRDLRGSPVVSGTSRWHQRVFWVQNRLTRGSEEIGLQYFFFWPAVEKKCYLEVGLWFQLLANGLLYIFRKNPWIFVWVSHRRVM